jgi:hypothetical protein
MVTFRVLDRKWDNNNNNNNNNNNVKEKLKKVHEL